MADVFISYSQKDRSWVNGLVDALVAEGYEVWWDLKIRAGESFDEVIESTLEKVSCVVGVWSKNSVKSEWVRNESAWAKDRGIFVSIRIDEDAPLPIKFYHVHTASMADWDGFRDSPTFRNLLGAVQSLAGIPSPLPSPSKISRQDHLENLRRRYGFPDWKTSVVHYQGIPKSAIEKALKAGVSHNDVAEILSWSGMSWTRALVYVKDAQRKIIIG